SPLRTILRMHRRLPEGYQVEDVLISDCVLDEGIQPYSKDGEVSEFRLLTCDELWSMIGQGEFTCEAELALMDSMQRHCIS
ncbi:MAG TPA: NUDIX hydrolase, partial [Burkholderiaceae bacterium]|nr:NUDIX hydrolase [Burkholderiaceae bacterium]